MTQKELLESVLNELTGIKNSMPYGELKILQETVEHLKQAITEVKNTLLNPENGVVVNNNRNTEYRLQQERNAEKYQQYVDDLKDMYKWKEGVTKALWILFSMIIAIICKMILDIDIEVGPPS